MPYGYAQPQYLDRPELSTAPWIRSRSLPNFEHRYVHVCSGYPDTTYTSLGERTYNVDYGQPRLYVRAIDHPAGLTDDQRHAVYALVGRFPLHPVRHTRNGQIVWEYRREELQQACDGIKREIDALFDTIPEILENEQAQRQRSQHRADRRTAKLAARTENPALGH